MKKTNNPPHYRLGAMNKVTDEKASNVGAAWVNENGTISIALNSFITLRGSKELVLTLFPNEGISTTFE